VHACPRQWLISRTISALLITPTMTPSESHTTRRFTVRDTQESRRLKHRNGLSNGDEPLTRYR
jgi:hypothetical protein